MAKLTKIEPTIPAMPKRKRVAAYARVSMQSERMLHSLSAQVSYYSDLIQSNPDWEYAGVYADDFISGRSTKNRKEFQRMIKDCESGTIDIVLCKSISRFARNTVDLLETVRHLKDLGVEVRFEEESINSMSGDGELMLTILASFAQEESQSISDNVKWGIRKGYKEGKMRPSRIFGYRAVNGTYEIVPEEAEAVHRIFDLYLSGLSFYKVAQKMNEEGYRSYSGKPFCSQVVAMIIRNEKYTGNSLLQKYFVDDRGEKKLVKNKGELSMFYSEETHPAIISQETFDAAQKEISERYGVEIENGIAGSASYFYRHTDCQEDVDPSHQGDPSRQGDFSHQGYSSPQESETDKFEHPRRKAQWTEEDRRRHAEVYKSRETMKYLHYDLSLFLKCEGCGDNLVASKHYYVDGVTAVFWVCLRHNKRIAMANKNEAVPMAVHIEEGDPGNEGERKNECDCREDINCEGNINCSENSLSNACIGGNIPRPVPMEDGKLKKIIAEVLGMEEFDAEVMTQQLSYISVAGDRLTFHFKDGHTEVRTYVKGKHRYSRKSSVQ